MTKLNIEDIIKTYLQVQADPNYQLSMDIAKELREDSAIALIFTVARVNALYTSFLFLDGIRIGMALEQTRRLEELAKL